MRIIGAAAFAAFLFLVAYVLRPNRNRDKSGCHLLVTHEHPQLALCVRAKLRLMVKCILRKYKYPSDLQDAAVELVLQQAQVLGQLWAV